MSREEVIFEVLTQVGVLGSVRNMVGPDADVVRMFDQDFGNLVELILKEKSLPGGEG